MVTIDIVIPYKRPNRRKVPIFSRTSLIDAVSNSDWYPVYINRHLLKDAGIQVRFFNVRNLPPDKSSNCIIIDSGIKKDMTNKWQSVKEIIRRYKMKGRSVILFDSKDSHNILMDLLPDIDLYMKKQYLSNKSLYHYKMEGGRLYTDYYHSIRNGSEWQPENNDPSPYQNIFRDHEHKLVLSWNILLAIDSFQSLADIWRFIPGRSVNIQFTNPEEPREELFNGNFTTNYKKELISYQRVKIGEFLQTNGFVKPGSTGYIPKNEYYDKLKRSKGVVSPFGWGEVCYRDFEAFLFGAALIKPDMSHLETWPDMYIPHQTYLPISWDPEAWPDELEKIVRSEQLMLNVAKQGQEKYRKLWSPEMRKEFCERFASALLTLN